MIRNIVFDLDDTLLRDNRTISDQTVSVLQDFHSRGIRIIPASGRARESMDGYIHRLSCVEFYIACNGAEIWDINGNLIFRKTLPDSVADEMLEFGDTYGVYMQTYYGSSFFYNHESDYAREYVLSSFLTGKLCPDLKSFIHSHPTSKILMMAHPDVIDRMRKEASERFLTCAAITTSKPYFLEVNPLHVSKGNALVFCSDHFGFDLKETIAFGDSLNDLSMLTASGKSVAVANARPEVLCQTDDVTLSNEQDGVISYLTGHAELFRQ